MSMRSLLLLILFSSCHLFAQETIESLYENRDYKRLISYSDKTDSLSAFDCYCIGYAYFQLENDKKAVEFYDIAIQKDGDKDYLHLYKGLALRYQDKYDESIVSFRKAALLAPMRQKIYSEMAYAFYYKKALDSAIHYFDKARNLPYEHGDPYYMVPRIYHEEAEFNKALDEYHVSSKLIQKDDKYYVDIMESIGVLEYAVTKNYPKAIDAYSAIIDSQDGKFSKYYEKLIKALVANEDYEKADEWIQKMTVGYENGELPEDYMKYKSIIIDQFEWNGYRVNAQKYFEKPTEFADPIYKFFVIDDDKGEVIRKIHSEKTIGDLSKVKHFICEWKDGTHYNYGYGFATEDIPYDQMKKAVLKILEGSPPAAASSQPKSKKKKKTKKSKKKDE